jgi:hypothetical protein
MIRPLPFNLLPRFEQRRLLSVGSGKEMEHPDGSSQVIQMSALCARMQEFLLQNPHRIEGRQVTSLAQLAASMQQVRDAALDEGTSSTDSLLSLTIPRTPSGNFQIPLCGVEVMKVLRRSTGDVTVLVCDYANPEDTALACIHDEVLRKDSRLAQPGTGIFLSRVPVLPIGPHGCLVICAANILKAFAVVEEVSASTTSSSSPVEVPPIVSSRVQPNFTRAPASTQATESSQLQQQKIQHQSFRHHQQVPIPSSTAQENVPQGGIGGGSLARTGLHQGMSQLSQIPPADQRGNVQSHHHPHPHKAILPSQQPTSNEAQSMGVGGPLERNQLRRKLPTDPSLGRDFVTPKRPRHEDLADDQRQGETLPVLPSFHRQATAPPVPAPPTHQPSMEEKVGEAGDGFDCVDDDADLAW